MTASTIVSLWEIMQKFDTPGCCNFFAVLGQHTQIASIASDPVSVQEVLRACGEPGALQEVVPDDMVSHICGTVLLPALAFCNEARLKESFKAIQNVCTEQFAQRPVKNSELLWTLNHVRQLMVSEMSEQMFFCISDAHAKQFDDPYPMLKDVSEAFPEANHDIREAYNCLVLDRNTAAIFHSMRVAEYGLRYLARKLRVTIIHRGKPQPIESATWDKIINELKSRINTAHTKAKTKTQTAKLSYYSDMADRCSYMKDLWRNNVMHTRRSYNRDEASGALQRVAQFMQLLAKPGE